MKTFYTVHDVAHKENVTDRTVRYWCAAGLIYFAEKIGDSWVIDRNYHLRRPKMGRRPKKIYT